MTQMLSPGSQFIDHRAGVPHVAESDLQSMESVVVIQGSADASESVLDDDTYAHIVNIGTEQKQQFAVIFTQSPDAINSLSHGELPTMGSAFSTQEDAVKSAETQLRDMGLIVLENIIRPDKLVSIIEGKDNSADVLGENLYAHIVRIGDDASPSFTIQYASKPNPKVKTGWVDEGDLLTSVGQFTSPEEAITEAKKYLRSCNLEVEGS